MKNTGTSKNATSASQYDALLSSRARLSSALYDVSMPGSVPSSAQTTESTRQARIPISTQEEVSPAPRKAQPFFVNSSLMVKVTSEVVSPLELVRSVTVSLTVTSIPSARNSPATCSTSAETA